APESGLMPGQNSTLTGGQNSTLIDSDFPISNGKSVWRAANEPRRWTGCIISAKAACRRCAMRWRSTCS
ncbi:hypothetical protein, partial [Chromobacterium amazonense]|uniref:hypothetical protein n=1 Tax=Chromobacterium amazonense TaxID=1382803 RepID=UPI0021B735EB